MGLTDIETLVLELMGENFTTPDNWSNTDDLRYELSDALDELCMRNELIVEWVDVALKANTNFYAVEFPGFYPLWFRRARLIEQDRDLSFCGIVSLGKEDPRWIKTIGSPYRVVGLSSNLIAVYPCYATDGGVISIECIGTMKPYDDEKTFRGLKGNFEEALIHYGKYVLYLQTAGGEQKAMEEFKEFLRVAGMIDELSWHKKMMWELGLKGQGE